MYEYLHLPSLCKMELLVGAKIGEPPINTKKHGAYLPTLAPPIDSFWIRIRSVSVSVSVSVLPTPLQALLTGPALCVSLSASSALRGCWVLPIAAPGAKAHW